MNTLLFNFTLCDAPHPWGLYFQDTASPQMEALIELHNNIMFYLFIILLGVSWILVSILKNYIYYNSIISNKYLNHGTSVPFSKCYKKKAKDSYSNKTSSYIFKSLHSGNSIKPRSYSTSSRKYYSNSSSSNNINTPAKHLLYRCVFYEKYHFYRKQRKNRREKKNKKYIFYFFFYTC
jgi:hypothetical protein